MSPPLNKVGIVVALDKEFQCLSDKSSKRGQPVAISEHLLVIVSGIGPQHARAAATTLIEEGANALVSWGCAAALDSNLKQGSLMMPHRIIDSDGCEFISDIMWHDKLKRRLSEEFTVHTEGLAECSILSNRKQKQALRDESQATCADMESAALARFAQDKRAPFLAIRAIADTAGYGVPRCVTKAVNRKGEVKTLRLMLSAIWRPHEWFSLIRLGFHFGAAKKTLSKVSKTLDNDFFT